MIGAMATGRMPRLCGNQSMLATSCCAKATPEDLPGACLPECEDEAVATSWPEGSATEEIAGAANLLEGGGPANQWPPTGKLDWLGHALSRHRKHRFGGLGLRRLRRRRRDLY